MRVVLSAVYTVLREFKMLFLARYLRLFDWIYFCSRARIAIIHISKKRKGRVEVSSMQDHAAERTIRLKAGIFEDHVLQLRRNRGPKIPGHCYRQMLVIACLVQILRLGAGYYSNLIRLCSVSLARINQA